MIFSVSARRFLHDTRAGATAIAAAAVTVMAVGGAALITDHVWLVDQRDTLKSAANSASIAATLEMNRMLEADSTLTDAVLKNNLQGVARRYIELNLSHLPAARFTRAKQTLVVTLTVNRAASRVEVDAEADLGGTLVARALPLLGGDTGPGTMHATATVECASTPIEVVLALDVTASMHGRIDNTLPATGDNRRLNAVIKAAKALVEELRATCDGRSTRGGRRSLGQDGARPERGHVAAKQLGGIWGTTARAPSRRTGWAASRTASTTPNPLDATALASATSMSLDLPGTSPFPAFIYPDTTGFSVTPMANQDQGGFPQSDGCNQGRPGAKPRSAPRKRLRYRRAGTEGQGRGQLQLHFDRDATAHRHARHRGYHARRHQDERSDGRRDHGVSRSDVGPGACSPTPGARCGAAASIPSTLPVARSPRSSSCSPTAATPWKTSTRSCPESSTRNMSVYPSCLDTAGIAPEFVPAGRYRDVLLGAPGAARAGG